MNWIPDQVRDGTVLIMEIQEILEKIGQLTLSVAFSDISPASGGE